MGLLSSLDSRHVVTQRRAPEAHSDGCAARRGLPSHGLDCPPAPLRMTGGAARRRLLEGARQPPTVGDSSLRRRCRACAHRVGGEDVDDETLFG